MTEAPEDSPDEWMPGEALAKLLARRLRLVPGIEAHEEKMTYPHEWGCAIDLYCNGLRYTVNLGESWSGEDTWELTISAWTPRWMQWLLRKRLNRTSQIIVEEVTLALERESGMPKLPWTCA